MKDTISESADTDRIVKARRWYADEVRYASGTESAQIIEAFATVSRERFLGPGPWQILSQGCDGAKYMLTPNDDPVHVYHNALIAIDASRSLNNGSPGSWASWLSQCHPKDSDQVLHVGCGTGYYSAILAELVGPLGSVLALEIDPDIAEKARVNVVPWSQVHVLTADGSDFEFNTVDLIVASAGVSDLPRSWIDRLSPGGRILVPLTAQSSNATPVTRGRMLTVTRQGDYLGARIVSLASFYPCIGAQDKAASDRLLAAIDQGGERAVRTLRIDAHEHEAQCWLHSHDWCLSKRASSP